MNLKTDYIKRIGRKFRSKRGTTLIEMLATLAILAIIAVMSLQVVVTAMEDYQCVRNISESQRSISLMQETSASISEMQLIFSLWIILQVRFLPLQMRCQIT